MCRGGGRKGLDVERLLEAPARPLPKSLNARLRERYLDTLASVYIYNEHRGYTSLDRVLEAVRACCPDDAGFIAVRVIEEHLVATTHTAHEIARLIVPHTVPGFGLAWALGEVVYREGVRLGFH